MDEYSGYVGLDTHKEFIIAAVAEAGRSGPVTELGRLSSTEPAVSRLVSRLSAQYGRLEFVYEAGPCGYGVQRQITALGQACRVAAPSRLLRGRGDRVKTDRRDARALAVQLRAGLVQTIWVPDERHEAIRDLVRARGAAVRDLTRHRQRLQSFLLRQRRIYAGKSHWTQAHRQWLAAQRFEYPAQTLVLQETLEAIRQGEQRRERLTREMLDLASDWELAPVARALQALRGVNEVGATILTSELGDPRRFASAPGFISYLGLAPSEDSSGDRRRRGGITKTGNGEARRVLIEAAWCYRHGARVGPRHEARSRELPAEICAIGWAAQHRLCRRYRALLKRGKPSVVATTAVARELAGFVWSAGCAALADS